MSWSDHVRPRTFTGLRTIAALSWRDYLAVYPPRVLLGGALPRAVLQVVFIAYLGLLAAGPSGRDFALVGASAQIIAVATVAKGADLLLEDQRFGTLHRLRLARLPLLPVLATRWWAYAAEGVVSALLSATIGCLLFGRTALLPGIWAAAGAFVLVAASTSALGIVSAALSMGRESGVFVVNLVSYLLLVLGGAVAPLDRLPGGLAAVAHVLPMTNGLLCVRDVLAHRPWFGHAAAEAAVAVAWFAFAYGVLLVQQRVARAQGTDDRE